MCKTLAAYANVEYQAVRQLFASIPGTGPLMAGTIPAIRIVCSRLDPAVKRKMLSPFLSLRIAPAIRLAMRQ
jgi:hypothetical protein